MRNVISTLFSMLVLVLAACGGDEQCSPGTDNCSCLPSGGCNTGFACQGGVCAAPVCPVGTEGCSCLDNQCGRTVAGEALSCMDGVCQVPSCPAGQLSCACMNGTGCVTGASCIDGSCRKSSCIAGSEGCECLAGSCNPGLQCRSGVCSSNVGRIGGTCNPDQTCTTNARCDRTKVPSTCVYCDLGTIGCQCSAGNNCEPGLQCVNRHCAGDETVQNRVPPADPKCYTRCQSDVVDANGVLRQCDAEGLIEGCLDDRVCQQGQCLETGSVRKMCIVDSDCPDFQQCMQGFCYSNCESDSECGTGQGCHMKVCRDTCLASDVSTCPTGTICDTADNNQGFCMAKAQPNRTEVPTADTAPFKLSDSLIEFSNVALSKEIVLTNDNADFARVTLTKEVHNLARPSGSKETKTGTPMCQLTDCPLWWIEMGEKGGTIGDSTKVEVTIPPNCLVEDNCPRVVVRIKTVEDVMGRRKPVVDSPRWRGSLSVRGSGGNQTLDLSYVERAEGRWAGKMVYFANFEDSGIDSTTGVDAKVGWLGRDRAFVDGRSANELSVKNGLIARWGAFRTGNMGGGWREMNAILVSTESGQWKWPSVVNACLFGNGACYLFTEDGSGGLPRPYVTNRIDLPIPSGSSTFPMALNLHAPDPAKPALLSGRVASEIALHFAGNPQVTLQFESDPSGAGSCDSRVGTNCVVFLKTATNSGEEDGLKLRVAVGGRYRKTTAPCAEGFEKRSLPWLIPEFSEDAQTTPSGFFEQEWCVDQRLPQYVDPITDLREQDKIANRSLARGNPIPNGRVIQREVQLLDGAMIDQSQIFLLFRETYPSFLDGPPVRAYGYMILERRPVDMLREDVDPPNGIPDDYEGSEPPSQLSNADQIQGVQCSSETVADILRDLQSTSITSANVGRGDRSAGGRWGGDSGYARPSSWLGHRLLCRDPGRGALSL